MHALYNLRKKKLVHSKSIIYGICPKKFRFSRNSNSFSVKKKNLLSACFSSQ